MPDDPTDTALLGDPRELLPFLVGLAGSNQLSTQARELAQRTQAAVHELIIRRRQEARPVHAVDIGDDPIERVRRALAAKIVPNSVDVRQLVGAFDSRGRQLDAVTGELSAARQRDREVDMVMAQATRALPDVVFEHLGEGSHDLADYVAALAQVLDNTERALRGAVRREAEYVDRLAGKAPSIAGPIPDQPGALDELRTILGQYALSGDDRRRLADLGAALAIEWGHYTGLRRQWQRSWNDHGAAMAALPESVRGDAAPEGATLADRVRALVMERDQARRGWGSCHARHLDVEAATRELVEVTKPRGVAGGPMGEAVGRAAAALLRHHAAGDGSHVPADSPSRTMGRHVEIVAAVRRLLGAIEANTSLLNGRVDTEAAVVRELLDAPAVEDVAPSVEPGEAVVVTPGPTS